MFAAFLDALIAAATLILDLLAAIMRFDWARLVITLAYASELIRLLTLLGRILLDALARLLGFLQLRCLAALTWLWDLCVSKWLLCIAALTWLWNLFTLKWRHFVDFLALRRRTWTLSLTQAFTSVHGGQCRGNEHGGFVVMNAAVGVGRAVYWLSRCAIELIVAFEALAFFLKVLVTVYALTCNAAFWLISEAGTAASAFAESVNTMAFPITATTLFAMVDLICSISLASDFWMVVWWVILLCVSYIFCFGIPEALRDCLQRFLIELERMLEMGAVRMVIFLVMMSIGTMMIFVYPNWFRYEFPGYLATKFLDDIWEYFSQHGVWSQGVTVVATTGGIVIFRKAAQQG